MCVTYVSVTCVCVIRMYLIRMLYVCDTRMLHDVCVRVLCEIRRMYVCYVMRMLYVYVCVCVVMRRMCVCDAYVFV